MVFARAVKCPIQSMLRGYATEQGLKYVVGFRRTSDLSCSDFWGVFDTSEILAKSIGLNKLIAESCQVVVNWVKYFRVHRRLNLCLPI